MNRASVWRSKLCPSSPYPPIEVLTGPCDDQICLDLNRTFSGESWFESHMETLRNILNTFSVVNEGFGYPQGLNYLTFPLFYVYYKDNPDTAVEDTFYSLQTMVRVVLPLYPLDAKDTNALAMIRSVTNLVILQCYEKEPSLSVLFSDTHQPFLQSIVSSVLPTLYANVFSLCDTLLLWDVILSHSCRNMFKAAVRILVRSILFYRKMFTHMPVEKSMQLFQQTLRESISVCL